MYIPLRAQDIYSQLWSGTRFVVLQRAAYVCLGVLMGPALCFSLPASLIPVIWQRLTPGSSHAKRTHVHTQTHSRCRAPPNARPSSPRTRQPVSANQLNRLRPENNPATDSPSGLPLSTQPASKADSRGRGVDRLLQEGVYTGLGLQGMGPGIEKE